MKTYTLTIAPDDGHGTQTVVNLQLDNGTPTITGLHLVALDPTGLSANQLPAIDLELLLAAVVPATNTTAPERPQAPRVAAAAATSVPALPSTRTDTPTSNPTPRPRATNTTRAPLKTATPRKATPTAKTTSKKAPSTPGKTKTAPTKTSKTTKTPATTSAGRTYRTMPEDIAAVFAQAKTATALADFYQVPAHTATGWIRTARKRGLIPESGRRRNS